MFIGGYLAFSLANSPVQSTKIKNRKINLLPLDGIKVLDATHVIAGPFASYQLCLMGAEAIRVERLGGNDFIRKHGGSDNLTSRGLGASFSAQNALKKCLLIDLKDPRGRDIFLELAAESDVVIENFRPGVMDRLGVGYHDVKTINPTVIYCSLTGFGPEGPLKDSPAYDHIVQGMSGLMGMTGTPESGPQRVGLPITDYISGLTASMAITAALHQRSTTGEGQHLQVSMLASVMALMGVFAIDQQTTGQERGLQGNLPFSGSPFAGRFETADGYLVITANTVDQSLRMLKALQLNQFKSLAERGAPYSDKERDSVSQALSDVFQTKQTEEWERLLNEASVPAGSVMDLGTLLCHEQIAALGCMDDLPIPGAESDLKIPGLGFTSNQWSRGKLTEPEQAGQSTRAVMLDLGYDDMQIAQLIEQGVIASNTA